MLAFDDARLASVDHAGKGRIVVRVVDATCTYGRYGSPDRKPGETPKMQGIGTEKGGVRFWMTAATASELIAAMTSRIQPEQLGQPGAASEPASPEIDIEQVAGIEIAHVARTDTQYVFLRAFDAPYALRLGFTPAHAARFLTDLHAVLDGIHADDREAQIEVLNAPVEVGRKPEVSDTPLPAPARLEAKVVPAVKAPDTGVRARLRGALSRVAHKVLDRFGVLGPSRRRSPPCCSLCSPIRSPLPLPGSRARHGGTT
jgi:hypothetical protein